MALVVLRSAFARVGGSAAGLGRQVHPLSASKMAAVAPIQVATMKATYGERYPYLEPYDYKNKRYTMIHEFFDNTTKRMNENSKVIVIDGNVAVGKNEFGKQLAKNFDLKFFPALTDGDVYTQENGFDMRSLNEMLPDNAQFYDLKKWLSEPHPEKGTVGRLQLGFYKERFDLYCRALQHLFHTGQGVVIVRSVYSDHVFLEAMRSCGYVTRNFKRYYDDVVDNSLCELLKPHVTVYLDAPLTTIRERMKARNNPSEVNSKVLSDKFLLAVEDVYKNVHLPRMRETGAVVEIDWSEVADDMDMEVIAEEVERLHLESEDAGDSKFKDWYKKTEDELCEYRRIYGNRLQLQSLFFTRAPYECPEICYDDHSRHLLKEVYDEHPAVRYKTGWAPEFGANPLLKF